MADPGFDTETADKVKHWITTYGSYVLLGIALGLGGMVGWNYLKDHRADVAEDAANLYDDYLEARGLGEPIDIYIEAMHKDHGTSTYLVYMLLHQTKSAVDDNEFETALAHISEAEALADDRTLLDLIRMRKARIELELDNDGVALQTLQLIRTHGFKPQALELKGDIHRSKGEFDDARQAYDEAIELLDQEEYIPILKRKLGLIPATT